MLRTSLHYFMTVARAGSIRAAASELGVAQSAISRQIQALEYELRIPLIDRHVHGMTLTAAGQLVYRHSKRTVFHLERFQSELDELEGKRSGHIRISAVESSVFQLLADVLVEYGREFPEITYSLTIASSTDVVRHVTDGTAAFGVCLDAPRSSDLSILAHCNVPLKAIVGSGHALALRSEIALRDLASHPFGISTRTTGAGFLFDLACPRANIHLTPSLETNSLDLLYEFVRSGGLAVMMRQSLEGLGKNKLSVISIKDRLLQVGASVDVIAAPGRSLPHPAERFLARICRQLTTTF